MKKEKSLYKELVRKTILFLVVPFLIIVVLFLWNIFHEGSKNYWSNIEMHTRQAEDTRSQHIDAVSRIVNRIATNNSLAGFFLVDYTGTNLQYYSTAIRHVVIPSSTEENLYTTKLYYQNETIPRGFNAFYKIKDINENPKVKEFLDSDELVRWVTPYEAEEYSSVFTPFEEHYTYMRKVLVEGKLLYLITVSVSEMDMDSFAWQDGNGFTRQLGEMTQDTLFVNYCSEAGDRFNSVKDAGKCVKVLHNEAFPQKIVMIFDGNSQIYYISAILFSVILLIGILVMVEFLFIRKVFQSIDSCIEGFETSLNHGFHSKLEVHGNNEISKIESAFNVQIDKIQELLRITKSQVELVKDSQLQALQHQINPHFLYNTLEVFSYKMELYHHYEEAEAIVAFSNMMRYNIGEGNVHATIREEMEPVSNYLCIQKIKFQNIEFENRIPGYLHDFPVLRFLFQPLIENSVLHGYYGKPLYISLSCLVEEEYIRFEVYDNGRGIALGKLKDMNKALKNKEKNRGVGIGLSNINSRLCLFYSDECGLELESEEFKWTRMIFRIPNQLADIK